MKQLAYRITPPTEGGSALPGCGTIHYTEIEPTLSRLGKDLSIDCDLNDLILGSTGKREYSGDIDLVIDSDPAVFTEKIRSQFRQNDIARNGTMLHLKYPIVQFNDRETERQPRTGFVQIDFNFGNVAWEKFYHYSDGGNSSFKGAHRNLAIAAICSSVLSSRLSEETDTYNRPIILTRWVWGPNGFKKVLRRSQRSSTNIWMKKQAEEIIDGPYYDAETVCNVLFPVDGQPDDLNSLETIMLAVGRNYGSTDCERIWKRVSENFSEWSYGKYFDYPIEIARYFPADDK